LVSLAIVPARSTPIPVVQGPDFATIFSAISAISSALTVVGIFFAFLQLREARKSIKAQVLVKLAEDWRSPDVYAAMTYVNRLRATWRNTHPREWRTLAISWVVEHAGTKADSEDPRERELWTEWQLRRTASQFLAKMGTLMEEGYVDPEDLFGVIPEMGRLLIVLMPIEIAIVEYWGKAEGAPVADWDSPVGKWEFKGLWQAYEKWQESHPERYQLNWMHWETVVNSFVPPRSESSGLEAARSDPANPS
jgi:hypothetical protein